MVAAPDYATFMRERHRLLLDVLRLAKRLGIEFAFPTMTIWQGVEGASGSEPADSAQAVLHGRAEARRVAEKSLKELGGKPPPVRYALDDPDAIGR
jgi:MscS family membrane protein